MSNIEKLNQISISLNRPLEEITRQYLLEAILRRLVETPLVDSFVLRGGMLMRMWVSPKIRPADDLDFLALFPYDLSETISKISYIISQKPTLVDGVEFDLSSVEGEATWVETPSPGIRVKIKVVFEDKEFASKIDVGFGDPLVPPAIKIDYPIFTGEFLNLLSCSIETALGWKLHGLVEFGEKRWRAKDLYDLYLFINHIDINSRHLSDAINVAFSSRNTSLSKAITMFDSPTWWTREKAQIRWQQFQDTRNIVINPTLMEIADCVKEALLPITKYLYKQELE